MLDLDLLNEVNTESNEEFYDVEPLACDFETTGLKKDQTNALTLSLVVCDKQIPLESRPALNLLFLHKPQDFQDVAVAMNARIFVARALAKKTDPDALAKLVPESTFAEGKHIFETYTHVADWIEATQHIDNFLNKWYGENTPTLLGKNIQSFDRGFFPPEISEYFAPEVVDVGALWKREGDKKNPSQAECCRRAGLNDKVSHDDYGDNLQAMQLWELAPDTRS